MRRSACTRRFITRSSSTSRHWTAQNITLPSRIGTSVWSSGDTLYAQNQYGRVYQDEDGDGTLSLPTGSYTFTMQARSSGVTGSITVPEQTSVTAVLDRTDWLKVDGFMLASASKTEFYGSKLPVEKKTARELTAVLDDSFTGSFTRSGRMTRVCFRMQAS